MITQKESKMVDGRTPVEDNQNTGVGKQKSERNKRERPHDLSVQLAVDHTN